MSAEAESKACTVKGMLGTSKRHRGASMLTAVFSILLLATGGSAGYDGSMWQSALVKCAR